MRYFQSNFSKVIKIVIQSSLVFCLPLVSQALVEDYGVASIDSPTKGKSFGAAESLSVTLKNFGKSPTTSLKPVNLPLDVEVKRDGKIVSGFQSVVNDSTVLTAGKEHSISLAEKVDLSVAGTYVIKVGTNLPADTNLSNNTATATIVVPKPAKIVKPTLKAK